jgi:hypothetical protein
MLGITPVTTSSRHSFVEHTAATSAVATSPNSGQSYISPGCSMLIRMRYCINSEIDDH